MTSTQATPRAHLRRDGDHSAVVRIVAVAVACVVVVVGLTALTRGPDFVSRLTVENPTRLPIEVSIASPGSAGRLNIGSVSPQTTASFDDVVDMGDQWEIRLVANGGAVVTTTVSRAELAADGWTFTIPDRLRAELSERGAIPGLGG
jgi:hypothetical protein